MKKKHAIKINWHEAGVYFWGKIETFNNSVDNFLNHNFVKWPAFVALCGFFAAMYINSL